ncbi:MAG TPA: class I SAM-dependent methyltransferase [Bryobacteraceae bacterium]|jgi:phospholipid N-methyltransferase|nr:class I SAM-dependent methyltransferase [Bryobacteraceae bacterium]
MNQLHYPGQELDLFAHAHNWKQYWVSKIRPFIRGDVLEVGAGLGVNTPLLEPHKARSWTAMEPDPELAVRLTKSLNSNPISQECKVLTGTTSSLEPYAQFDCALYIDVLEHIEEDKTEIAQVANLIRPGGRIIVLSPAHQLLYTPFDKSIGHFRRYNRASLLRCTPPGFEVESVFFLDSVGMLASLANKVMLQQSMPKLNQLRIWDRFLVPTSTILDRLLLHKVGKSVVAIWRRVGAS